MSKLHQKNKGFTLIELLVVIAIIAILSTIISVMFSSARVKAKDTVRKADLNSVKTALELYANDHNGTYPSTIPPGQTTPQVLGLNGCNTWTSNQTTSATSAWIPGLVSGGYISQLPHDPDGLSISTSNPTAGCSSTYLYASDGKDYAISNSLAVYSTNPEDPAINLPVVTTDSGVGDLGSGDVGGVGGGGSGSGSGSFALLFSQASSSYVSTPAIDTTAYSDVTLEFRIKTTDSNGAVISSQNWGQPGSFVLMIGSGQMYFQAIDIDNNLDWSNSLGPNSPNVSSSLLTDGSWHHVALVQTGGYTDMYVDGAQKFHYHMNLLQFNTALTIGASTIWGSYSDHEIDEVRISNTAVYTSDFSSSVPTSLSPSGSTIVLWKFDDGTGLTALDSSSHGNIATLVNNPTWVPVDGGTTGGGTGGTGGTTGWTCGSALVDTRNSNSYTTSLIGGQCWMSQNLNIGTKISGSSDQGSSLSSINKYCYNDSESSCTTYGGLYEWNQVMGGSVSPGAQGICMTGWHVPTHDEWSTMERSVCTSTTCTTDFPLNSGVSGWRGTNEGTTLRNPSGLFKDLLAGIRMNTGGSFVLQGTGGYYWTSTDDGAASAWHRHTNTGFATINRALDDKNYGFSVRCVNDSSPAAVSYNVAFDANGGLGSMSPQTINQGLSANLTGNSFTRTGYTFSGWSTTPTGSVSYTDGASYSMGGASVTLYAVWASDVVVGGGGVTYYINIPEAGQVDSSTAPTLTGPFTVELMYRMRGGGTYWYGLLKQPGNGGAANLVYAMAATGLGEVNSAITTDNSGWIGGQTNNIAANDGNWHHFAIVYDGSNEFQYFDGVLKSSWPVNGTPIAPNGSLQLGAGGWGNSPDFDTRAVRISSIARDPSTFSPSEQFTNDSHTELLWLFNEGSGSTVSDSSGHGHTLNLNLSGVGATTWGTI